MQEGPLFWLKTRSAPGSVLEGVLPEFLRSLTFTGPNPTESVPTLLKQPISAALHSGIAQCNYSLNNYWFLILTVLLGTSLLPVLEGKSINDFLLNSSADVPASLQKDNWLLRASGLNSQRLSPVSLNNDDYLCER